MHSSSTPVMSAKKTQPHFGAIAVLRYLSVLFSPYPEEVVSMRFFVRLAPHGSITRAQESFTDSSRGLKPVKNATNNPVNGAVMYVDRWVVDFRFQWLCHASFQDLCDVCKGWLHHKGSRKEHALLEISSFSLVPKDSMRLCLDLLCVLTVKY